MHQIAFRDIRGPSSADDEQIVRQAGCFRHLHWSQPDGRGSDQAGSETLKQAHGFDVLTIAADEAGRP